MAEARIKMILGIAIAVFAACSHRRATSVAKHGAARRSAQGAAAGSL